MYIGLIHVASCISRFPVKMTICVAAEDLSLKNTPNDSTKEKPLFLIGVDCGSKRSCNNATSG